MISFEEILRQSKANEQNKNGNIEKENEINYVKIAIDTIIETTDVALDKYTKQLKEKSIDKTEKEKVKERKEMAYSIEKSIEELFRNMLEEITEKMPFEEDAHLLNSYQYLIYNQNKLKEIYREIKDEKKAQNRHFSFNQIENQKNLVEKILKIFRDTKNKINEEEYKILVLYEQNPKYRKQMQEELKEEDIEYIKEKLKFVGNEEQKFIEFFKSHKIKFYENIKRKYIESLIKCGSILGGFGLLHRYQKQHTRILTNIGLKEIAYEIESKDEADMDITKLFSEKTLKELPVQNLIALNSFWTNRLAKEIERMNQARFICQDLGVFEKILQAKSEEEQNVCMPTDEEIDIELLKLKILNSISRKCIFEIEKDIEKLSYKEKNYVDVEPYVNTEATGYQDEYFEYFKKILPNSSNILTIDMIDCITANNMIHNLYKGKSASQLSLLENALISNQIKNWGYIEDNSKENCILLGFDIEGLNMPLRLHITEKYLKKFLDENGLENKLPVYRGNKDFTVYGSKISAPLIMPLDKKRISKLKNTEINFEKDPDMARYIEHCRYLVNTSKENYPKHLKKLKIIGKGKKEKRKYIIPEEYIDIDTKEIFEKDGEGKFVRKDLGRVVEE